MKRIGLTVLCFFAISVLSTSISGQGSVKRQVLNEGKKTSGVWKYVVLEGDKRIDIGGKPFKDYGYINSWAEFNYATFYIKGSDWFEGYVGILEQEGHGPNTLIVKVDGKLVQRIPVSFMDPPIHIKILLTSYETLTLQREKAWPLSVIVANPNLIQGRE